MPDGIDLKRIIDLDPETTVTDDDYTIVDSLTGGAKKFALGQALGEIKDGLDTLICPNLAGSEVGKDYPVYIPAGTQMTISTSDGSIFPTTSTLQILLKNAEGVQTDYFTVKTGQPTKTFTVSSSRGDVYYLAWNETPSVPLMVNVGGTALPYVEYFTSVSSRVMGNLPNLETADSSNLVSAINDSLPRRGVVYPSDYSNLISHIVSSGKYQIQDRSSSEKWTDYPTGATAGTLIVYRYGTSYVLQVFYAYLGDIKTAHYRIVNISSYANYIDWTPLSLMWKRGLTASDNLNNITTEGIYRWPNVASTPQNAPFNLNAFLLVLGNLPSTNCVQICFSSILDDTGNIAIRASQSSNTVWTPWVYPVLNTGAKRFDTAIVYQNSLTSSDDLNNVVKNGIYNYSDANIPSHAPATGKGGIIQVIGSASTTSQKLQIYTGYGVDPSNLNGDRLQTAYRALGASVWSEWRYVRTGISPLTQRLEGKRISILGDSISTYAGYVPTGTGYATYYTGSNCGVSSVDQTWWKRLIDETGLVLCKNNSVSGSCMSTGARQDRISGCLPERTGALTDANGNSPDYIIVYMGMNDFVNNVEIGTYDGFGNIPSDVTIFRNAYATALLAIMTNYPNAKIFVCTTHHTEYNTTSQEIQIKGSNITQAEFNEQIRELARIFCLDVIDFEHCGITTGNITSCTGDNVESGGTLGRGLHPNAKGHELLFREALKTFNALRQ